MAKRVSVLHPDQLAFTFGIPKVASGPAALAGLDRFIAAGVSDAVRGDPRSTPEVAGALSSILDQKVSADSLYSWMAESRDAHNISAGRWLGLVAVTHRHDVLNAALQRIGASVLVGDEVRLAEIGHIDREIAELADRKRQLQALAKPMSGEVANDDRGRGGEDVV